jgi:hypothetical protein
LTASLQLASSQVVGALDLLYCLLLVVVEHDLSE